MLARVAANLTLLIHLAFVLFVVFGGLLALRWRRAPWVHLPALAWGVFVETTGRICPLTPLENHFRILAGEAGYAGGFVEHYLLALLYPAGLTQTTQWILAGSGIVLNIAVYALALRQSRRGTRA